MNGKRLSGLAVSSLLAATGIALAQAVSQPAAVNRPDEAPNRVVQTWDSLATQAERLFEATDLETLKLDASLGYSQAEGAGISVGLQADDVLGSGNDMTLDVGVNSARQALGLEIRNDRFRSSDLARRLSFSTAREKPNQAQGADYTLLRTRAVLEFKKPLPDDVTIFFGLGLYKDSASSGSELPEPTRRYLDSVGSTSLLVPLHLGFVQDQLDDPLKPTSGRRLSGQLELGLLGDVRYMRALADLRAYRPLAPGWTLGSRIEVGHGRSFGDDTYPVFRNFVASGPGFVRGYAAGSLGGSRFELSDGSRGSIGGTQSYLGSLELLHDPARFDNLRLSAFIDVGSVLAPDDGLSIDRLRGSVGVGLSWSFGNGALSLSVAQPFNDDAFDEIENIQFGLTARF